LAATLLLALSLRLRRKPFKGIEHESLTLKVPPLKETIGHSLTKSSPELQTMAANSKQSILDLLDEADQATSYLQSVHSRLRNALLNPEASFEAEALTSHLPDPTGTDTSGRSTNTELQIDTSLSNDHQDQLTPESTVFTFSDDQPLIDLSTGTYPDANISTLYRNVNNSLKSEAKTSLNKPRTILALAEAAQLEANIVCKPAKSILHSEHTCPEIDTALDYLVTTHLPSLIVEAMHSHTKELDKFGNAIYAIQTLSRTTNEIVRHNPKWTKTITLSTPLWYAKRYHTFVPTQ